MTSFTVLARQRGMTLIELLVALAVSLVIVIAATSLLVSTGKTRDTQDSAGVLQDNARFATDIISKALQQSGYQNYMAYSAGASTRREVAAAPDGQPDLRGFNNSAAVASADPASAPDNGQHNRATSPDRVNNSDTLVVRYQGYGASGDTSMVDCLGKPILQPASAGDRAYSIFYVNQAATSNEPELMCKYLSGTNLVSTSVVRGVEALQVMYGVDTDGDSFVDKWLNAEAVDGVPYSTLGVGSPWQLVKAVRVGMVIRSPDRTAVGGPAATLAPLGSLFSEGVNDTLAVTADGRLRKLVTFTIVLRNSL